MKVVCELLFDEDWYRYQDYYLADQGEDDSITNLERIDIKKYATGYVARAAGFSSPPCATMLEAIGCLVGVDYREVEPTIMQTSDKGVKFILRQEGFRSKPYDDGVGVMTIGYGHAIRRGEEFPEEGLTREEALELFRKDLAPREKIVRDSVQVPLTQGQFDALVSLVYNIGATAFKNSTLLRLLNEQKNYRAAAMQFGRWVKGRVKGVLTTLRGLVKRRAGEREMFEGG